MTHVNILMVGCIVSETQTDRQLKFIIDICIYWPTGPVKYNQKIFPNMLANKRPVDCVLFSISQLRGYYSLYKTSDYSRPTGPHELSRGPTNYLLNTLSSCKSTVSYQVKQKRKKDDVNIFISDRATGILKICQP